MAMVSTELAAMEARHHFTHIVDGLSLRDISRAYIGCKHSNNVIRYLPQIFYANCAADRVFFMWMWVCWCIFRGISENRGQKASLPPWIVPAGDIDRLGRWQQGQLQEYAMG
jgi:hypothetical protein